jgi:hypothetical protein
MQVWPLETVLSLNFSSVSAQDVFLDHLQKPAHAQTVPREHFQRNSMRNHALRVILGSIKMHLDRLFVGNVLKADILFKDFQLAWDVCKGDINRALDRVSVLTVLWDTPVCQDLWNAVFVLLDLSRMGQKDVLLASSKELRLKLALLLVSVRKAAWESILTVFNAQHRQMSDVPLVQSFQNLDLGFGLIQRIHCRLRIVFLKKLV